MRRRFAFPNDDRQIARYEVMHAIHQLLRRQLPKLVTINHDEIRQWVEERKGKPASIEGTEDQGEEAGLLRIDFSGGASNPPLVPISWDAFFQKFDDAGLAMVYQDETADGSSSHFCKFIRRESVMK